MKKQPILAAFSKSEKVLLMENGEDEFMLNSSMIALRQIQMDMEGEAEKAGLFTEDDVVALCRETRKQLSGERSLYRVK